MKEIAHNQNDWHDELSKTLRAVISIHEEFDGLPQKSKDKMLKRVQRYINGVMWSRETEAICRKADRKLKRVFKEENRIYAANMFPSGC